MKVIKSSHISPFGGLNFVIDELDNIGINRLVSNELPTLSAQCVYGWRDLLYNFWSMIFCGGDCIEDVGENFKKSIGDHPSLKVPSPDRILDRMKELSIPTELYDTPRGTKKHEFSHNDQLNRLNIKILKRTSTFDHKRKGHILDYDNTLIFTRKADAKMTYKKEFGYAPGVGIIGNHVVYVENRNGNSDAQTLQQDTLQRMFDMLRSEGITVNRFRADGASYQLSTLDVISRNVNKFYVRTRMGEGLYKAIEQIDNWKPVKDGDQVVYRGDIMFTPFEYIARRNKQEHLLKKYRLVVTKVKRDDGQINLFSGEPYNYYGIITNDYELGNDQIVSFYNQRGAKEKEFDVLKNDFCWGSLPFSKLEHNTVFLLFTAMCRNLYHHVINVFAKKYKGLANTFRIKKFIYRFICIPAKWIKTARCWKLRLYGEIELRT
jgi:hypothetical protein